MSEKYKRVYAKVCKVTIVLMFIQILLLVSLDSPLYDYLINNYISEKKLEEIILGPFIICVVIECIILYIGYMNKVKLSKPKTKKYNFSKNFNDFYKDIKSKIEVMDYNFIKNIELYNSGELYLYAKISKKINRLVLIINDKEYNNEKYSKDIIGKVNELNARKMLVENIEFKEIIIIHYYDRINESFISTFINDTIIFNDYMLTTSVAIIKETSTLYIPKEEVFNEHAKYSEMKKEINYILNTKYLSKTKKEIY